MLIEKIKNITNSIKDSLLIFWKRCTVENFFFWLTQYFQWGCGVFHLVQILFVTMCFYVFPHIFENLWDTKQAGAVCVISVFTLCMFMVFAQDTELIANLQAKSSTGSTIVLFLLPVLWVPIFLVSNDYLKISESLIIFYDEQFVISLTLFYAITLYMYLFGSLGFYLHILPTGRWYINVSLLFHVFPIILWYLYSWNSADEVAQWRFVLLGALFLAYINAYFYYKVLHPSTKNLKLDATKTNNHDHVDN